MAHALCVGDLGDLILFFSRSVGNPQDVLKSIADRHTLEPTGEPSLQNAIEMARGSMKYAIKPFFFFSLTFNFF